MSITAFLDQAKDRIDSHGYRAVHSICVDAGLSIVLKLCTPGRLEQTSSQRIGTCSLFLTPVG